MTIVAGVVTDTEICMFADCRLSTSDAHGRVVVARDVCQKLVVCNGWSMVGFAGDLCLGRDLFRAVVNRVRATDPRNPHWLRSDEAIQEFIHQMVRLHRREVADHRPCQRKRVDLMIGWLDYGCNPFLQPMEVISISSPSMAVRRTTFGIEVIGSGEIIHDRLRAESFIDIFCRYQDEERGHIGRALFSAGEAAMLLRRSNALTVGGLFQIGVLSTAGAGLIPHFQLVPLREPWVGTYVAMRIRGGMWLQEHRPTGRIIKVMAPYDIQLRGPQWVRPQLFQPASELTADSPGVVRFEPPLIMDFCEYNPEEVPIDVRRSWGDEPLEPLSWAQGPPPKRWRRH